MGKMLILTVVVAVFGLVVVPSIKRNITSNDNGQNSLTSYVTQQVIDATHINVIFAEINRAIQ